jgi:hypothetical protein
MALALCLLWLAGFEVLPWMHVAMHEHVGPHHHDASGAMVLDSEREPAEHQHAADDDDHDGDVDEHAADHDDHDHDVDAEVDEHGAPVHKHDHPAQDPHDGAARLAAALAHGQHSLAHHGVAVPTPAPLVTRPLPVDRRPLFLVATAIIDPISYSPGRAVARGPPTPLLG